MATRLRRVISARVAQSNTPETDAMPQVMHIVSGESMAGTAFTVKVLAEDPMTALDKVAVMDEEKFQRLERIEEAD